MSVIRTGTIKMEVGNDETSDLACPNCNENYLHHIETRDFARSEDCIVETRTTVRDGLVASHLVANSSDNPSSRRHGVVLAFSCECCGAGSDRNSPLELTLAQHKGFTQIGWRYVEPRPFA